jgi:hypothetical protein
MFVGESQILDLIKLLQERKVSFYHACQLKDLTSYLKLGGIPARGLLADSGLPFTAFKSDGKDKKTGDWDRVFLNMNDFGSFFHSAKGSRSTPNIYGPILLKLNPDCIEDSVDVSLCLCSAGSSEYDRNKFSLSSTTEVDQLFQYQKNELHRSAWLKTTPELRKVFNHVPVKGSPEISCAIKTRLIKMDYLTSVLVDPLEYSGKNLVDVVTEKLQGHDDILASMVKRSSQQSTRYNALIHAVRDGHRRIDALTTDSTLSEWAKGVTELGLGWQYERFAGYLSEGTLELMSNKNSAA